MKYCSKCNAPAFDNQNFCQKCGKKFEELPHNLKNKNKAYKIFQTVKTKGFRFIKNYKHFKELPKKSKIKHVAYPIIFVLVFSIFVNGFSNNDANVSSTVKDTNQHNNAVVLTYCDEKRAFFNFTYKEFVEQFNLMIAKNYPNYSPLSEDSALSKFSELTVSCLIGQKSIYKKLTDDIVLCTVCELRTSNERSPFDSNIAEVYILADKNECDINEISSLYKDILKIVNPNYSDEEINNYTNQIVPSSFSGVDNTELFDENIRFANEYINFCDYNVFSISASKSEELKRELENYENVACSNDQLKKAVKILQSNSVQNDLGLSSNLYYTICSVLGGNPEITGEVDYYGNINVRFSGTYQGGIDASVTYKVSLEYGDCMFSSSSLNWDYVMAAYKMG